MGHQSPNHEDTKSLQFNNNMQSVATANRFFPLKYWQPILLSSISVILLLSTTSISLAQVAAGTQHCLFIKTDGTLWAKGSNDLGQLGDATTDNRSIPVQITSGVAQANAIGD